MDDCISRQAVLDIVIWEKPQQMIIKVLELPSVTPTYDCDKCCDGVQTDKAKLCQKSYLAGMEHTPIERTGHWIMDRQRETRQCDKCMTVYRWSFNPHNYCPNCGRRMVEPQEGEGAE